MWNMASSEYNIFTTYWRIKVFVQSQNFCGVAIFHCNLIALQRKRLMEYSSFCYQGRFNWFVPLKSTLLFAWILYVVGYFGNITVNKGNFDWHSTIRLCVYQGHSELHVSTGMLLINKKKMLSLLFKVLLIQQIVL